MASSGAAASPTTAMAASASAGSSPQQSQQNDNDLSYASHHLDISQLPSLKDGMTIEEESMKRRKTCRFIEEAGRLLKLPRVAVATAMVFFHRFYAKHSFQQHDRFEVAVASIVLAAKTEESPKKLNVVIDEAYKLKVRGMQAGRISQTSNATAATAAAALNLGALDPKAEEFLKLKERILLLERVILHTIGFELSIDHPYKFLVEQIKLLVNKRLVEYINPTPQGTPQSQVMSQMMNNLVQCAMNFANDSMQTSLCLQFGPQKIATSCVYLAGKFAKVRPCNNKSWLEILGYPNVEGLASISLQIIELIQDRKGADQDTMDQLRQDIESLKDSLVDQSSEPEQKRPRTE